jgi:hypothetical protein
LRRTLLVVVAALTPLVLAADSGKRRILVADAVPNGVDFHACKNVASMLVTRLDTPSATWAASA